MSVSFSSINDEIKVFFMDTPSGHIKPEMISPSVSNQYVKLDSKYDQKTLVRVYGDQKPYIMIKIPKGATLYGISKQFGVPLAELQKLNQTDSLIIAGKSLKIPVQIESNIPRKNTSKTVASTNILRNPYDDLPSTEDDHPINLQDSVKNFDHKTQLPFSREESLTLGTNLDENHLPEDILIEGNNTLDMGVASLIITDEITGAPANYNYNLVDKTMITTLPDIGVDLQIGRFEPLAPAIDNGYGDFMAAENDYDLIPASADFDIDFLSFEGLAATKTTHDFSMMTALGRTIGTDNIIYGASALYGTQAGPATLGFSMEIFGQTDQSSFHYTSGMSATIENFSVTAELRSFFDGENFEYETRFMGTLDLGIAHLFTSTTGSDLENIAVGITGDHWNITHQGGETLVNIEIPL